MVFFEDNEEAFEQQLRHYAKSIEYGFEYIKEEHRANETRKSLQECNKVIVLCQRSLAIGFDLKLGKPAVAIVVANKGEICGSEV